MSRGSDTWFPVSKIQWEINNSWLKIPRPRCWQIEIQTFFNFLKSPGKSESIQTLENQVTYSRSPWYLHFMQRAKIFFSCWEREWKSQAAMTFGPPLSSSKSPHSLSSPRLSSISASTGPNPTATKSSSSSIEKTPSDHHRPSPSPPMPAKPSPSHPSSQTTPPPKSLSIPHLHLPIRHRPIVSALSIVTGRCVTTSMSADSIRIWSRIGRRRWESIREILG